MGMFTTKHAPAHPGAILRERGVSPDRLAWWIGVPRTRMQRVMNQETRVTPDTAVRLARAFPDTTPGYWLSLQGEYDAWFRERHIGGALRRIEALRFETHGGQKILVWPEGPRKRWLVPGYDHAVPNDLHPPRRGRAS
jgi:addiction module HigA family antidote